MSTKKIQVALVTSVIDNRKGRGTALVAQRFLEQIKNYKNIYDFTLIHFEKSDDPLYKEFDEIIIPQLQIPFAKQMLSELWFFVRHKLSGGKQFDIYHYLNPRVWPSFVFAPSKNIVVTAHEAGVMKDLHTTSMADRFFRFANRHLNFRMSAIIAVSQYGKNDIHTYYKAPMQNIFVVPNGVDAHYTPIPHTDALYEYLKEKYQIPTTYILSVSRLDPHKNILRLLEAYALFVKEGGAQSLVLVGGRHLPEYSEKVGQKIKDLGIQDLVHIAPYIQEEDMPKLYSAARAFIFPSYHEGFGLPIIEAMACGTPVATGNLTASPEVAGGAAILFDPHQTNEMTLALHEITENEKTRAELREKGFENAKKYTWEKSAQVIFSLYTEVLNR